MDSYDVRFWDTKKLGNGPAARHRVRWAVDGREHCKSFKARPLADGFPRRPQGCRPRPAALQPAHRPARSRHGRGRAGDLVPARPRLRRGQVAEPRPGLPPVGRRGAGHRHRRPHRQGARRTGREGAAAGAVRLGIQPRHPPARPAPGDRRRPRLGRARLPAGRRAGGHRDGAARAGRLRQEPDGEAAAGSTQRRKRSVFCNALGYAVEQGHLASNPVDRIQWTTPSVARSVDRRVVVSPAQARSLLPPSGR
jgi:hypothetical protein